MTVNNQPREPKEYRDSHKPTHLQESSLADEITRKMSQLQNFGREVSAFINGFQLNVDRDNGAVQINLRKKTRPLVELIPLLKFCEEIKPMEAIIGWNKTQEPMFWVAGTQSENHLLISGAPQSGKTGLLRSLILTLVLATRPSQLQLAIIDGSCRSGTGYDHSGLKKFSHLPHLLNRPPSNPEEVCEIVSFLAKEADHRLKHQIKTPQILLIIDNLQDILPVAGPEFHQQLEHILDIGPQTGIRVILATNRPEDGRLQDLVSGIEIDRLTGKVQSAGQAAFASGRDDSDAEFLDGNGEFLARLNGNDFHFQAAWVGERQLKRYLQYISDVKQPALLAWSIPADDDHFYDEGFDEKLNEQRANPEQREFNYGFLEQHPKLEAETHRIDNEAIKAEYEEEDDDAYEEEVDGAIDEPIEILSGSDRDKAEELHDYEQNQKAHIDPSADDELLDDHFFEEDDLDEELEPQIEDEGVEDTTAEEARFTQLANIYTKLTGFLSDEPEDDAQLNSINEFESNEDLDLVAQNLESESWDEEDFDRDEEQAGLYEPDQSLSVFHEPTPEYNARRSGWLDYAPDSSNPASEEVESDTALDFDHASDDLADIGDSDFEDEGDDQLTEDDAFSFSSDGIAKPGRRSRLSQPKPKPSETPPTVKSKDEPDAQPDPFDPWQNGLADEPENPSEGEKTKPTTLVRPPRLVAKRTPTIRRRVSHTSNHFKPKPKPKAPPAPDKVTEENIDGEIE